jgi:hypothetical protein
MAALAGRNGHREAGLHAADAKQPDELSQWVPASLRRAQSRGQCFAAARWECAGSQIAKVTGHNDDYLFYRSPLTGDFDVECDVTAFTCQSMTAGTFLGNDGDRSHLWIGTFRNSARRIESQLTFSGFDDWIHHRAVSRTGIVTQSLNGLNAHVENVTSKPDPWFAVRSWWRMHAGAKDIRISGTPVIPESIDLSAAKDLRGWYPYFEESAGELGAAWEHLPDTLSSGIIVGHRGGPDAAFSESLLAYQRPLETVGSIEYEFFYEPGQSEVHPALDRMVFCLFPEGVRIHWLTDGIFDQTSLGPDNMFAVASAQSQTSPVPLKPGEWNGLILAVNQQSVTLHLNGQRICETELDAANDRVFGLFHYADQTEAKVRNVVMRGNWPTTLPDTTSQELADLRPAELDAELPKLSDVFTHDFSKGGIPAQLFAQGTNHPDGEVKVERDGLSIHRPGGGPWRDTFVNLPLIVHGDFDMEIVFEKFAAVGDEFGCIMLVVELDDEQRQQCRILRIRDEVQRHELHSSLSKIHQSGERSYSARLPKKSEASGGRLRMARRGTTLYYLFAENDSSVFRVLETEEISDRPSVANGLHFHTMCSGKGDTRVIWKSISVRAERLVSINVLNPQP